MTDLFNGFDPEKEKSYRKEARERFDPAAVKQAETQYSKMSEEELKAWQEELDAQHKIIAAAIGNLPIEAPQVQNALSEMHRLFNYFYDCTLEIFKGLGAMYCEDPRFRESYEAYHPGMPEYLRAAMALYSDKKTGRV